MNTNHTRSSFSSDDSKDTDQTADNLHVDEQENSANGLDSTGVTGGQNGRNIRGMGSQDMDTANGVLRLNDTEDGAMDVPEEAIANAAASESQTKTSTADVTTAGPDDYASAPVVNVPNAQKAAKQQQEGAEEVAEEPGESNMGEGVTQADEDEDIAETGTSINHQPTY